MSGSESAGAVAGASTVAAGAAVASSENSFLSFLGWAAIALGVLVLLSFIAMRLYKSWLKNHNK
jgi:uncharacterized membrane protein YjfL (UPF0719 family)